MMDPTGLAIEAARRAWAMVEAFRGNKEAVPDLFWSVQNKSAQVEQALGQLPPEADSRVVEVVARARVAVEKAQDLLYEFVLAYSPTRFALAPEYQERIAEANTQLGDVMADLRTQKILELGQDVPNQRGQGSALPGAADMHQHWILQPVRTNRPQLPNVPISSERNPYNIEVMKLMARLAKKDGEEQRRALKAVVSATEADPRGRLQVAVSGLVPLLVNLLQKGPSDLHHGAISALANLCKEAVPAKSVLAAGAIVILVQYAQGEQRTNRDAQAQCDAVDQLMKLVRTAQLVRNNKAESGALNTEQALQVKVERAIIDLSRHASDYRRVILSAGVVPPLMQLLRTADEGVQEKAIDMLHNLTIWMPESRPELVSAGAISALFELLEDMEDDSSEEEHAAPDTSPLQAKAALLIARLACPLKQIADIIPVIVNLLDNSDTDIQVQAAQAIASIWQECPQYHSTAVEAGAFIRLAERLEEVVPLAVQRACAESLASMYTKDPIISRADIRATDVTYALLKALKNPDPGLQSCAALAVANLSKWDADLRCDILATGTISPFVELWTSADSCREAQKAAKQVLQNLPCDAEYTLKLIQERNQIVLKNRLTELASDSGLHEGCKCIVCVRKPLPGRRYRCKVCPAPPGYNVCGQCKTREEQFATPRMIRDHCTDHAMMLTVTALQIVKAAKEAGIFSQNLREELTQLLKEAIQGKPQRWPSALLQRWFWPRQQ